MKKLITPVKKRPLFFNATYITQFVRFFLYQYNMENVCKSFYDKCFNQEKIRRKIEPEFYSPIHRKRTFFIIELVTKNRYTCQIIFWQTSLKHLLEPICFIRIKIITKCV